VDFIHESNEVEWETFEDLARVLTPLVASLVTTEGYVPPLDVSIVDALNHLVVCMEMNSRGVFRHIADRAPMLRATLPMVITVTETALAGLGSPPSPLRFRHELRNATVHRKSCTAPLPLPQAKALLPPPGSVTRT
jgi:hypothetical protein